MPVSTKTAAAPRRAALTTALSDPKRAWAPYEPSARQPWDLPRAAHLLRRSGFGPTWEQLQQALTAGPPRTVDALLQPIGDIAGFNRTYDAREAAIVGSGGAEPLRAWWLRRMIETPHALLEKMTLFWHDYFAANGALVPSGKLMHRHMQLLRTNALGRFPTLLAAIARDPATLLSVGAAANRKTRPDEHLARQLLDRYTVGPGNYSAKDVREAARAGTGWVVLRSRLRFFERDHDTGAKTVLGQTGKFTDEDVVRIAAGHPATARNVVRRLYRWFVSEMEDPTDALIAPLAEAFARDFDLAKVVATILRSNLFFSPVAYHQRVKRPVEFALGIVRGLEGTVATNPLADDLADLGENLLYPPTTGGWTGGRHWINRTTVIGRANLATALLAGSGTYDGRLDPAAVARKHGHSDAAARQFLTDLFLQPDPATALAKQLQQQAPTEGNPSHRLRQFADLVVTLPEFNLA